MGKDFSGCICCRRRKKKCRRQGPTEDCLNCRLIAIECLHGFGRPIPPRYKGPEVTARIRAWTRRPSNRNRGVRLPLSDIGRSVDQGVVAPPQAGSCFTRRDHASSIAVLVPTPSDLSPNPVSVHHAPPHETMSMSPPVPRPVASSPTSVSPVAPATNISSGPIIDASAAPFPTFESPADGGNTCLVSQLGSFLPTDTGYFSAASGLDGENVNLSIHERQRTHSSGTDSSLESSLAASSESFLDASQYPYALHRSEILGSPYSQDGYEAGGWLESGPLAGPPAENVPCYSETFVPAVTPSNVFWDLNILFGNEAMQSIGTGASNGSILPWIIVSSGDHQPSHETEQDNICIVVFPPPSVDILAASVFDTDLTGAHVNDPIGLPVIDVGGVEGIGESQIDSTFAPIVPIIGNPIHSYRIAPNNVISFASELHDTPRQPPLPCSGFPLPLWPDALDPCGMSAPYPLGLTSEPRNYTGSEGNVLMTLDGGAAGDHSLPQDFCGPNIHQPSESSANDGRHSRPMIATLSHTGSPGPTPDLPHARYELTSDASDLASF